METSDKSYSVQTLLQKERELYTKIEDIIKIIGLKNPKTYRSKQHAFGPVSSFMEPVLEEGASVWGLPIPEKYWELLPGNIVAIADKADRVCIGKITDKGHYFLLTNPAGDLSEKINKCEIASTYVIEKPNADDSFEVEEVKEYLLSNTIDASKDSLFELITFTAGRLYYDEKHPYQAAARVKSEINNLIETVYSSSNITQIELERCLQATEMRLTHRHRVSQIAAVQETRQPDLVELKSFIEKKIASKISYDEGLKKGEQGKGERNTEDNVLAPTLNDFTTSECKDLWPLLSQKISDYNYKPKDFAILIHALKDLELLLPGWDGNKVVFHTALMTTFNDFNVGNRSGLSQNLAQLNGADATDRLKIKKARDLIKRMLS